MYHLDTLDMLSHVERYRYICLKCAAAPSRTVQNAEQQAPEHRDHRRVTPVVPLSSISMTPTDRAVHERDTTGSKQYPAQGLPCTEKGSRVDGQAHEDVPRAVDHHQAVDHLSVRGGRGCFELEESERVEGTEDAIDPESNEDGCKDGGGDVEDG